MYVSELLAKPVGPSPLDAAGLGVRAGFASRLCLVGFGMAFWWVNHRQTRDYEVQGEYLWSPKFNQNGARNRSYDNMVIARPGDIVFSYAEGQIAWVGIVLADASTSPKPIEFGKTGIYWSDEGWHLPVAFQPAVQTVRPRDHIDLIVPLLPEKYSPIQENGNGNQGIYLAAISDKLGELLLQLTNTVLRIGDSDADTASTVLQQLNDIDEIKSADIPETQRIQLVKARVGQGLFRSLVLLKHPVCRITGVADKRLLRASHIKPWKVSDNFERLDGNNGIMLSPHVDALFDQGLMSFEDSGRALFRNDLKKEILQKWSIPASNAASPFQPAQRVYLRLHREKLEAIGAYRH
jgi:putative restriction endonuclease